MGTAPDAGASPVLPYEDRAAAGENLAVLLAGSLAAAPPGVVLGLPRGGVVVAAAVAARLEWPLDVVVVRKLGVPWHSELAMGAIGPRGVRTVDQALVSRLGVSEDDIERVVAVEDAELRRREQLYRGARVPLDVTDRTVVVVDDGLATGSTARAACRTLRLLAPRRIILAVPVGPAETVAALRRDADDVVCPAVPAGFVAVGQWYRDFGQTTDEEVIRLLEAT